MSLLEFGEIDGNYDYQGLLEYAIHADKLGFNRIWFGEHYADNLAFSNPEPLLPVIASMTKQIRVGVGGILLKYHSPYRIACFYRLLSNLFFERIDLGLCKTYLPEEMAEELLGGCFSEKTTFDDNLKKLLSYLDDQKSFENGEKYWLPPLHSHTSPSLWILNSAFEAMRDHPNKGLNFCRSLFHDSTELRESEKELLRNNISIEKSVAIALYCSNDRSKNDAYKNLLKKRKGEVSKKILSCTPEELKDYFQMLNQNTGINEVVILNLGVDYKEKTQILNLLSEI